MYEDHEVGKHKKKEVEDDKVEQTSMVQDDMQAFVYPANFDTDFRGDFFDEF